MVLRAYPEQVIQQLSPNTQSSQIQNPTSTVIYVTNQDMWEWAIKALVLVGCIIIIAYVAKKLFE